MAISCTLLHYNLTQSQRPLRLAWVQCLARHPHCYLIIICCYISSLMEVRACQYACTIPWRSLKRLPPSGGHETTRWQGHALRRHFCACATVVIVRERTCALWELQEMRSRAVSRQACLQHGPVRLGGTCQGQGSPFPSSWSCTSS